MDANSKATTTLEFVLVRPNERRRWLGSTKVVRSAAARHQWKESKEVNPRGRKSSIKRQPMSKGDATEYPRNDDGDGAALALAGAARSTSPDQYIIHAASDDLPSPLSIITNDSLPTDLPREIVGSLFSLACRYAPAVCGSYRNSNAPTELIRHILSSPANFHSCILTLPMIQAKSFDGSSVQSRSYRTIVEQCRVIAIAETRELLGKVTSTMYEGRSDDVQRLLSIVIAMWLSSGPNEASASVSHRPGPRQASLQKLEALDRMGPAIVQNMHTNVVLRLVELNGGLDAVTGHNRLIASRYGLLHIHPI